MCYYILDEPPPHPPPLPDHLTLILLQVPRPSHTLLPTPPIHLLILEPLICFLLYLLISEKNCFGGKASFKPYSQKCCASQASCSQVSQISCFQLLVPSYHIYMSHIHIYTYIYILIYIYTYIHIPYRVWTWPGPGEGI